MHLTNCKMKLAYGHFTFLKGKYQLSVTAVFFPNEGNTNAMTVHLLMITLSQSMMLGVGCRSILL